MRKASVFCCRDYIRMAAPSGRHHTVDQSRGFRQFDYRQHRAIHGGFPPGKPFTIDRTTFCIFSAKLHKSPTSVACCNQIHYCLLSKNSFRIGLFDEKSDVQRAAGGAQSELCGVAYKFSPMRNAHFLFSKWRQVANSHKQPLWRLYEFLLCKKFPRIQRRGRCVARRRRC